MSDPRSPAAPSPHRDVVWHDGGLDRTARQEALGHAGATVWLTGLSGSGKSTVAFEVERRLVASGRPAYVLDGDNLRHGLNAGLGFSAEDRAENVRRVGEVALLLADAGVVALAPLVSPYRVDRARVRSRHESAALPFLEVHVATPLEECERRDPKGLYAKARAGEISGMTGIDDPWEPPEHPDLVLAAGSADDHAAAIVALLAERGIAARV
ncbi:adenylyl-sulfate kinase [Actinomarinicola tropica]|uniref:Adenylyl-sulfate kinase n=1 Tax=Actinomarinicola tropica TaxID=2789776 RepID=A0A5Q2RG19_9ACTN|nr:adenylyl-sulfate kinase [Actinomarinicola tropica]QGG93752.1 adenylyl-sulfate kinase [Actinomarinicola tropica]